MLRFSLASLLASTFLLSASLSPGRAQILKNAEDNQTFQIPLFQGKADLPEPEEEEFEPEPPGGGFELKRAVGFERWTPEPAANADVPIAPGIGWFYCSGLTPLQLNTFLEAGYRPIDIEVEDWESEDLVFSAAFVQNLGPYEVEESIVLVGQEGFIRELLFGGEWTGYRIVDLEVKDSYGTETYVDDDLEVPAFETAPIAVLIVPNEGHQYTPEWDFIVHATPFELTAFDDSFTGEMRVIDHEISFGNYDSQEHDGDQLENVLYSKVIVANEGIEYVETDYFQFSSVLELIALEDEGWQLIDSERNIPLMYEDFPEIYGEFTGVFVQKPNLTSFYEEQDTYSLVPQFTEEERRVIDIELVPDEGEGSFLLDELYLLYD